MATFLFTLNRRTLREKVARKLGIRAAGNSLKPEDSKVLNEGIDLKLKEFHSRHILWFSTSGATTTVALTSATSTVEIEVADFLFPITFRVSVAGGERRVEIIDHTSYQQLCDKTRTGVPEKVFFSGTTAYLWPVPNDDYDAALTYQGVASDSTDAAAIDMNAGAMDAFSSLVALSLADEFDVDEAKIQRWMNLRDEWMKVVLATSAPRTDRPESTAEYF